VKVSHLLFADDLAILASSQDDLQRALNGFAVECEAASMKINTGKTESLVVSRKPVQCTLHVSGVPLKQVEKFKYLGVEFASEASGDGELDRRIGAAGVVMRQLGRRVLGRRELSRKAKLAVYRSIFIPTLTYGHELWVMTDRTRPRVQAAEMRFLRRVVGRTLFDRVRNSATREELRVEPLLLEVERGQLRWLGHVLRMGEDRLVTRIFGAEPVGRRGRGRPRTRWKDQLLRVCERVGLADWPDILEAASDRVAWRALARGLTPRLP